MRAALAVLALLFVAGCTSEPDEPKTFAMDGVVSVGARFVAPVGNLHCQSTGMTPNLSAGTPVVVRDGAGTTIGSSALLQGSLQTDGTCKFRFTPAVPSAVDFYAVQVGDADPVTVDSTAARRTVGLSFGV